MKSVTPLLVLVLAMALMPCGVRADGIFVEPKFVWDKHKDINEPTQKGIIVYDAGQEDLILQVKYAGPVDQFGWLIPVPNLPAVQEGSMKCLYELSKFTQKKALDATWNRTAYMSLGDNTAAQSEEPPVKVVEIKTIGAYETAVLSAKDSRALEKWLDDNHFYLPPDKSDVIDSYVKEHYYFVAVKINLGGWFSGWSSTPDKLSSGELNPLQISFASDRCVFPLKISSINGTPSEVQLYVLSPEPLLEQTIYEKQMPLIYSNDMARAESRAQSMEKMEAEIQARMEARRATRGLPAVAPRLDIGDQEQMIRKMRETPRLDPDETLQFAKAADGDLPECTRSIPRLGGRSWWVAKDTWTFQAADMRDLEFGPALPEFAETLGSKYGYIAAANLNSMGASAIPVLLAAIQSPNSMARANAAGMLDQRIYTSDPRIQSAASSWLTNSEPQVRKMAVYVLSDNPDRKPMNISSIIPLLSDNDAEVRDAAVFVLLRDRDDLAEYAPVFKRMLADTNPAVRVSGLRLAFTAGVIMDRSEWLSFLRIPDQRALGIAATHFRRPDRQYDLSDDEAVALLQNPEPLARLIGLEVLREHADPHAIELARPFLNDTNASVRFIAARDMGQMTGATQGP